MPHFIEGNSISVAWEKSLSIFLDQGNITQFNSQRGACHEASDVLLSAPVHCENTPISKLYPKEYLSLVDSYSFGFTNASSQSTVANRLYRWRSRNNMEVLNQVERLISQLEYQPNSRFNILGFWDPETDGELVSPVSPINCNFRVRSGRVDATLVARTVDAWLGGFPMFIALSRFLVSVAESTNLDVGRLSIFMYSYHVYDIDLPIVRTVASRNQL